MASKVQIFNLALKILGAKRVSDPDEDSRNGRACNDCYEAVRDALLEQHPWGFAGFRTTLAPDAGTPAVAGDAPEFDFQYAFAVPSDLIRLTFPRDEIDNDWQRRGDFIMTNAGDTLYLNYIRRITDTTKFPPSFVLGLAADMADFMCEDITQSNEKKAAAGQRKKDAIALAKRSNAFQTRPIDPVEDTLLSVRR